MAEPFIRLTAVRKVYGWNVVFENVNLALASGEFACLTGANGAGKSSLLNVMAGTLKPDKGAVSRREDVRLGYLGHATFVYPRMSALENLRFWAAVMGLKFTRAALLERLARVGLKKFAEEKAGAFSRGMAQRLNFARFCLNEPNLLLLDEPYTGLDAAARRLMREEIERRVANGSAAIMATHAPDDDAPAATARLNLQKRALVRVGDN